LVTIRFPLTGNRLPYSDISLNQVCNLSFKHATELIARNGGEIRNDMITMKVQKPQTLRFEQSFEGMYPVKELLVRKEFLDESIKIDFTGNGIVVTGNVKSQCGVATSDYVALLDVYIDGAKTESVRMPYDFTTRKYDIFYKYMLINADHKLEIKWMNPDPGYRIYLKSYVVYADSPAENLNPGGTQPEIWR
jgi:hypothetical protein